MRIARRSSVQGRPSRPAGPETSVDFQFQIADFISNATHSTDLPTLPEVVKLYGRPLACSYGAGECASLRPRLDSGKVDLVELQGGHHFEGGYVSIAQQVTAPVDSMK